VTSIKILSFYVETDGSNERCEDNAIMLSPDVAAIDSGVGNTYYIVKVKPSEEDGFYTDAGPICDIAIMNGSAANMAEIPPEALVAFATWITGAKPAAVAV
jgi:hypothetical protein